MCPGESGLLEILGGPIWRSTFSKAAAHRAYSRWRIMPRCDGAPRFLMRGRQRHHGWMWLAMTRSFDRRSDIHNLPLNSRSRANSTFHLAPSSRLRRENAWCIWQVRSTAKMYAVFLRRYASSRREFPPLEMKYA
ncbi:hypothetical protein KM043_009307 [Ampulex compressa]|nr:hypothetical protein KM043_009307 [Ampulex compressa]